MHPRHVFDAGSFAFIETPRPPRVGRMERLRRALKSIDPIHLGAACVLVGVIVAGCAFMLGLILSR